MESLVVNSLKGEKSSPTHKTILTNVSLCSIIKMANYNIIPPPTERNSDRKKLSLNSTHRDTAAEQKESLIGDNLP